MSELVPIRRWAKLLDQSRCIGCHACSTACKSENGVPLGVHRTYVKAVEVGSFPAVRRAFQVTRCNQCDAAPCTVACPTRAMYRRRDGIVDFDKAICIGCKACIAACPYDAIFINPDDGAAEKCNLCSHRIDAGLEPACVTVCPTNAIVIGDLDDEASPLAERLRGSRVRKPEKQTRPKVFYQGATEATLDPLAARRPDGGLYLWAEQPRGPGSVAAGHPGPAGTSAAALLAYDVAHCAPWDWRVSLYTWTKGVAAGVYLVALGLLALGALDPAAAAWRWRVPGLAAGFLGLTGGLLLADLEHPERFLLIFTRHHGRSWLVRGAFVIAGYGAVLAVHLACSLAGRPPPTWLAIAGAPLAAVTAIYTAFLFAQARARDLWQSRLLAPHLAVQAIVLGAAAMIIVGPGGDGAAAVHVARLLAIASAAHLALIAAEVTRRHATEHARLAVRAMTAGSYARVFWPGVALAAAGLAAPWLPVPAAIAALAGMLCFEHAHVQAGQIVPLA